MSPRFDPTDTQLVIGNPDDNQPVTNNPRDEQSEREWRGQVAGLLHDHYFAGDIDKVRQDLNFFKTLAKNETSDAELGSTETSACRGILKLAEYCCDQLCFPECLSICESVKGILEAKRARYIRNGLAPESDSMAWLALLTNLAECKWKNPDPCKDAVISLEQMIQCYRSLEIHIRQKLLNLSTSDIQKTSVKKARTYFISLAWCGTFLLGAISKYAPARFSELKNFVNSLHEGILDDISKPYKWYLSIIMEYHSPKPSRSEINENYRNLRKTAKDFYESDFNFHAFDIASRIEQGHLNRFIVQA